MSDQARKDDPTICPLHAKGTITDIVRDPRTTVNGIDTAQVGDCATCITGDIDVIVEGAATVTIGERYATRVGNKLWHGGMIEKGSPNVEIGGATITSDEIIKEAKERAEKVLKCAEKRLNRWNDEDKAMFKKYFGSDDDAARQAIQDRVAANQSAVNDANFHFGSQDETVSPEDLGGYAHVTPDDASHNVYLDQAFWSAPTEGTDNQTGTMLHEMSHFDDVGGTYDNMYGRDNSLELAKQDPAQALSNADNYEYYMENVQETCK
ncbi:MAG: M35 family metallo-endopeptidase [Minicystis sp.]